MMALHCYLRNNYIIAFIKNLGAIFERKNIVTVSKFAIWNQAMYIF